MAPQPRDRTLKWGGGGAFEQTVRELRVLCTGCVSQPCSLAYLGWGGVCHLGPEGLPSGRRRPPCAAEAAAGGEVLWELFRLLRRCPPGGLGCRLLARSVQGCSCSFVSPGPKAQNYR